MVVAHAQRGFLDYNSIDQEEDINDIQARNLAEGNIYFDL